MKTAAEKRNNNRSYKQKERDRKRALGLSPLEIWCKPEHKEAIKAYASKLSSE